MFIVCIEWGNCFFASFFVGDDRGVAGLTAGCCQRQDAGHGHGFCQLRTSAPEIPDINAGIGSTMGDCLGRIDDTATANCQDEIGMEGRRHAHALAYQ